MVLTAEAKVERLDQELLDQGRLDQSRFEEMVALDLERALVARRRLPDGFHVENHENGSKAAAGMIRNGDRVEEWSEWHEGGSLAAQGAYIHGKRHGPWTYWDSPGNVRWGGEYLYGVKEGDWVEYGKDGRRSTVGYRGGKKYGLERVWGSETGELRSETTWFAAEKDGPAHTWHANGKLESRGNYSEDKPTGLWEYWNSDGTLDEARTGVIEDSGRR